VLVDIVARINHHQSACICRLCSSYTTE